MERIFPVPDQLIRPTTDQDHVPFGHCPSNGFFQPMDVPVVRGMKSEAIPERISCSSSDSRLGIRDILHRGSLVQEIAVE